LVQVIVGVAAERRAQTLVEELVRPRASGRRLVEPLIAAIGGDAVERS
jgi:hypothetical protein